MLKTISKIFSGGGADEDIRVIEHALDINGYRDYSETADELSRLNDKIANAETSLQKKKLESEVQRHERHQNCLKGAVVILASKLDAEKSQAIQAKYGINDTDEAKVTSGLTNPQNCSSHELARLMVEQAQSDFIRGKVEA